MQETQVQSLGGEDLLKKEMATHFGILAWETPWTEEPGGLHSMESQRLGHNVVIKQQHQQQAVKRTTMRAFDSLIHLIFNK